MSSAAPYGLTRDAALGELHALARHNCSLSVWAACDWLFHNTQLPHFPQLPQITGSGRPRFLALPQNAVRFRRSIVHLWNQTEHFNMETIILLLALTIA
jgi:hypothetical protein